MIGCAGLDFTLCGARLLSSVRVALDPIRVHLGKSTS